MLCAEFSAITAETAYQIIAFLREQEYRTNEIVFFPFCKSAPMSLLVIFTTVLVVGFCVCRIIVPPANFPKNIPTIPFYVTLVPVFTRLDQNDIFNRYFRKKLETHGAVKVYFASRWNILVTRPKYISQILRENDIFEKSGNSEKIPHAVVSEYLGDNIISAGNENWKTYRKVITNSILFPDSAPLDNHIDMLVSELAKASKNSKYVKVGRFLQSFSMTCIGDCILGCNLNPHTDSSSIHRRVTYLKTQIFRPFFMNFPVLDKLPFPSRTSARKAVHAFKEVLCYKIREERTEYNSSRVGPQLVQAVEEGTLTEKQFQDNAMITLVAGHENPQILLTNVLYLLAKHQDIQKLLRTELQNSDLELKDQCPYLQCVVYESIRLYPPIGQLINRITRKAVWLGNSILIPKGTYVGINSFFTQRDNNIWKDADSFKPERWGSNHEEISKTYMLAKSRCELTAFHGRNRACLGEKFALLEVRKTISAIVENFEFALDPSWDEKITSVGPIWPVQLSLSLRKVTK